MVNLFDILRQAQGGSGIDALSRQFGLSRDQASRAVEALLPAFSLAFLRSAQDPQSFASLLGLLGSGRFGRFYDHGPGAAQGRADEAGQHVLVQLFGDPETVRQIAAQASAMTGIGAQVLQQMLPNIAATLVGGMFRYASLEGFADLLQQWSEAFRAAAVAQKKTEPPPRPASPPDPWTAWLGAVQGMMEAQFRRAPAPPPPPPPAPGWPSPAGWAGLISGPAAVPRAEPPPPAPPNPFDAVVRMFETGREVQTQHLASLQSIIDRAWAPGRTG